MSTSNTKLGEDFLRIPKLSADGENWMTYKDRLQWSIDARGLLGHMDGTEKKPTDPMSLHGRGTSWVPKTPDEVKELAAYRTAIKEWRMGEAIVKQQIAGTIPDSLFIQIKGLETAKDIFTYLSNLFEKRSRVVSVELLRKLQDTKCPEKGNVREHFDKMRTVREQLSSLGHAPEEESFTAIIMSSLPPSYDPHISALTASAKVSNVTLTADTLMATIVDEYDRRAAKIKKSSSSDDAAYNAHPKKPKFRGKCHNCGERGHKKWQCTAEGGGKAGQKPDGKGKDKNKSETAASAKDKGKDNEPEGVWLAQDDARDEEEHTTFTYTTLMNSNRKRESRIELFDSGASRHMSSYRDLFQDFVSITPKPITTADKHTFEAIGKGNIMIVLPNGQSSTRILLKDVLYAPKMGLTLVSISRLAAAGYAALFRGESCRIFNDRKKQLGEIPVNKGLYCVKGPKGLFAGISNDTEPLTMREIHARLGHMAPDTIAKMIRDGTITGIKLDPSDASMDSCDSCEYAKATRKPIGKVRDPPRRENFGDEVHTDLWGPSPVETTKHKEYFVSFTDDHTRFTHLYLLRSKDETFDAYKKFEAWVNTQFDTKVKRLRSDRGGEFTSEEFTRHLASKGTERKLTVHDTPEHNGVAERLNRTIVERTRALLHASGLPKFLWGEAISHATWLKNRTVTRALNNKTPYEMLFKKKPNLEHLPIWGCRVKVHSTNGSKLDMRAIDGRWVGFDPDSNGHRIYLEDTRRVAVERSVTFDVAEVQVPINVSEKESGAQERESTNQHWESTNQYRQDTHQIPTPQSNDVDSTSPDHLGPQFENAAPLRRSSRLRVESAYIKSLRDGTGTTDGHNSNLPRGMRPVPEESNLAVELGMVGECGEIDEDDEEVFAMIAGVAAIEGSDPTTVQEARARTDWPKWEEAIDKELVALRDARTWSIVERPEKVNIVGCKWVFRIKRNADGEIDKYKARLVAKGYSQVHGVDYYDTYAPVARLASLRTILAIAARNDWNIDVFDFHSAFLNGKLDADELIYMELPPGLNVDKKFKHPVAQLHVALYGSKQGALKWYQELCRLLHSLGMKRAESDWGVFYKHIGADILILASHVDDCTVTGSNAKLIEEFKRDVAARYKLTDLGPIASLLGMKVTRDRTARTISFSHESYIDAILTKYNFTDLKPCSIPMDPNIPLSNAQSPKTPAERALMKNVPYREAVGSLMHLAVGTRPDIAFAVSTVAQYGANPGMTHWEAVKKIYRYLAGTKKLALTFGNGKRGLEGFTDADGASQEHRHAISGYAFLLDGGAVSWSSKKQELVTLSTTEAEYVAATHAAKEAVWLRRFLTEVFRPLDRPTTLHCDNQSAIALANSGAFHARTKHIDIHYHFIRFSVDKGSISLVYCPTNDMVADTLTKPLPSLKAKHFATALGLRSV